MISLIKTTPTPPTQTSPSMLDRNPWPQYEVICDLIENKQFAKLDPTRPIQVLGSGLDMHCELR